ncbi:acyl-CoA dehydrogenase [Streptomyces albireticuli]|uniref:Acyl-CoA dehydrogenase n=1 Tax=Streptomyces albireticuli TaxID=1940 RepID=A0A1Z2LCC1_9ACTN|nr:acyl-CoA dehydrogenase [Streptomyces albireticuli]
MTAVTTLLTEDQTALVDTTLDFAREHLAPHAVAWDQEKHFPSTSCARARNSASAASTYGRTRAAPG